MVNSMAEYKQLKDARVTNESCWKGSNDHSLPNPPINIKHAVDELYAKMTDNKLNVTKIIMAHEFRENPEGFKSIAQDVVDAYNKAHTLSVGGEVPESLDIEKEARNG